MRIEFGSAALPRPPVAVNSVVISAAEIARKVQNHPEASPEAAWDEATRALVIRALLLQRGRALGIVASPVETDGARETEEAALLRASLEREVHARRADEASCRRYCTANRKRFRAPDLFEPRHILFQADREDEAAHARACARAEAVSAELQHAPERFGALARALSDCSSAGEGGRAGQVTRGQTTPPFEAVHARIAAHLEAAAAAGAPLGVLVAGRVRHLIYHGGEELWLDLIGVMARSPQPAAAAVERVLSAAFPAPRPARAEASA
ncbi:MAG: peptidylprolyl isomerase [Proteobacteria bacterium]|nr:peptidylprolyl isomerase [Pseudomonadota bacterium]